MAQEMSALAAVTEDLNLASSTLISHCTTVEGILGTVLAFVGTCSLPLPPPSPASSRQ